MQISDLTAEQARELANPGVWTVQALIDKLPHVHPWWMRDAVNNSCENRAELERRIVALMDTQANELSRLYMGLVMFFLSHPRGREAFLAGLRSGDAVLRKLVLDQFRIFRDDDLGCDGAPGKLPASCEEVLSAIVPLLQEPVSYQGGLALDFALRPQIFNLSLAHTRPLLAHDDQAVRNKVALAYLHHGRDDGALDTLATGLFAPGVVLNDQTKAWPTGRQGACYALKSCAEHAGDPDIRLRAGVLALQVVRQTLRAHNAKGRFPDWVEEGLRADVLLNTITLTHPAGAEEVLLREAIGSHKQNAELRSLALLCYFDLTGSMPPEGQDAIDAMIAQPGVHALDERLEQFAARKMIGLPALLAAARNPAWCYMATKALGAWPRGANDELVVDGLIVALADMAVRTPFPEDGLLDCIADLLHRLPRSAAHDRMILESLKKALEIAQRNPERPWNAQKVLHQLIMFGDDSAGGHHDVDPWDAMWAHWRSSGISWDEASSLLNDTFVANGSPQAESDEARDEEGDVVSRLCAILKDWIVPAHLTDEGYEYPRHQILVEQMAARVNPPLGTDAFSQTGEWHGDCATCQIRFIYREKVYGFSASPIGDWLDIWALVDGFNDFLRDIGHANRIYRLFDPSDWGGEWGLLLCANEERFIQVNQRLRIPLHPR
ncbi:MAG TPA: hypothetical protein VF472_11135 [Burkholderiaceae bacterium]